MITKITGEQSFQVLTNNFSISPSNEGYTLQISADGKNFSNLFTVGAGVTRLVTGVAANSYYRLSGNESQVVINWMKTCVTEGGGGSGSGTTYTAGEFISIEQDVISVTGITPDEYLTSADTQDLASQAYVDAAVTAATQDLATENYVDSAISAVTSDAPSKTWVTGNTESMIATAMAAETARTENTYAKPSQIPSLAGYATENYVDAAITAGTQDLASQGYVNSAITAATQGMATESWVQEQGYLTEHQDLSDYAKTTAVTADIASAMAAETARTENTYAKQSALSDYYTTAQTYNRTEIDTKIAQSGTFDPTQYYNKQDVDEIVSAATEDMATEIWVQEQGYAVNDEEDPFATQSWVQGEIPDISDYYTKAEVDAEITGATQDMATKTWVGQQGYLTQHQDISGKLDTSVFTGYTGSTATAISNKADKQNVTARASNSNYLPGWNSQGVITGSTAYYSKSQGINGTNYNVFSNSNTNHPAIFAPTSAGTAGQPLLSNGSGAPVWGGYKFAFLSQSAYDALSTKDSTTIYFIVSPD